MASTYSFDIVSEYDLAEVINSIDQAKRELGNRYDLKGTSASLEFRDGDKTGLTVVGDNQFAVDAILDIVRKKFGTRGVSQKVLDCSKAAVESNMKVTQDVPFKKGLDQDKSKKITKVIREDYPKVKAQIQGDAVRVIGSKKDELQGVMQLLDKQDFDFPLNYTNYR